MSANTTTFEVRVRIKGEQPIEYHDYHGEFKFRKALKMLHIEARTPEQAVQKARKHGLPISCRRADIPKIMGDITNIQLEPIIETRYGKGNPYKNPMAMDEMIWNKFKKRNERISKRHLDKEDNEDLTSEK